MKRIVFDASLCNGCYGCQFACKDEHCGNDWRPIASAWLGPRFGAGGAISFEYSLSFAANVDEWNSLFGISYSHPSGFHGTVFTSSNTSFAVSLGKTFLF